MTREYNKHADTEEYWNPHKNCYEVEINGKEYVITPENVGFQDGRINCYINHGLNETSIMASVITVQKRLTAYSVQLHCSIYLRLNQN